MAVNYGEKFSIGLAAKVDQVRHMLLRNRGVYRYRNSANRVCYAVFYYRSDTLPTTPKFNRQYCKL
jgi:hypothetical protein